MKMIQCTAYFLALMVVASPSLAKDKQMIVHRLIVAQSDMCQPASQNARTCYLNWKNIGGGNSGQAESFRQCAAVYCQALTAAGCSAPAFCSEF
jgi:hypothetical protein